MSFLKSVLGGAKEPPQVNLRDTLFGDLPMMQWPPAATFRFKFSKSDCAFVAS